jgi:hypothetical protein
MYIRPTTVCTDDPRIICYLLIAHWKWGLPMLVCSEAVTSSACGYRISHDSESYSIKD